MQLLDVLSEAVKLKASDIFIVPGLPLSYKVDGEIKQLNDITITPDDSQNFVKSLYITAQRDKFDRACESGDDDFSFSVKGIGRFRTNIYVQRGTLSAVIRVVPFGLPDYHDLGIPDSVISLCRRQKGLVLVTGPSGSGKSTTLACMVDQINKHRNCHVLTLEDPIEFLHRHDKSIVSQREVSLDTKDYVSALKAAVRQAPDVILVGEMRDLETMEIAITAAETGHLVLSTLHTVGVDSTIDRIIDVFPAAQQQQIRVQLSMVLQGVVSQHLIPSIGGGREVAFEIMIVNNAIRSLIRDSKVHQIDSVVHSSAAEGMQTMDMAISKLYKEGKISRENALLFSRNPDVLARNL